jgi:hypothetical protein
MKQKSTNKTTDITRELVNSSTIKSMGYDKKHKTLEVEFHVRGKKPPVVWRYSTVSPLGYRQMKEAKSIGAHFAKHIKNNPLIHQQKMSG